MPANGHRGALGVDAAAVKHLPDGSPIDERYRIPALPHRQGVLLMVWIGYVLGTMYVVLVVLR